MTTVFHLRSDGRFYRDKEEPQQKQVRFNFRNLLQLLPEIRYLIAIGVESSIFSIDSDITYNIIREVIYV